MRRATRAFRLEFSGCRNFLVHAHDLSEVRICEVVSTAKHGERNFARGGLSFKPALTDAQDGSGFVQCTHDKDRIGALRGLLGSHWNLAHESLLRSLGQLSGAGGHAVLSIWPWCSRARAAEASASSVQGAVV
jgi:hypothetical protein